MPKSREKGKKRHASQGKSGAAAQDEVENR
jgi:hypothetical protein